jgi:hypothetical protein
MADGWFTELHPDDGGKPDALIYFADFATVLAFVKSFTSRGANGTLRVHPPAHGTQSERRRLRELGAEPI